MSRFKTIYVMPHSHFDYGYTHPQAMLLELQKSYLTEAVDLCLNTRGLEEEAQYKWTIEANYILHEWLKDVSQEYLEKFRRCLAEGRIAISALPFHTTPLVNLAEMTDALEMLRDIRQKFDYEVRTAVNHDVNGQPWPLQQLLQSVGVDFYLTGINIHFGGIPFERPAPFLWEGPDQSKLTCFLGEHYSLFSQFVHSENIPSLLAQGCAGAEIYERMREGLEAYENELTERSWSKDFYFLTSTNPPLYDNNNPDHYISEMIQIYNQNSPDQKIQLITVDELRSIISENWQQEELPIHTGDWTDFWNFGAGSTPAETRIHKQTQIQLEAVDWLNTLGTPISDTVRTLKQAKERNLLFAEHTWGASESITDPGSDSTKSQRVHKDNLAWDASALSAFALGTALETMNAEPGDFSLADESAAVSFYNPTAYPKKVTSISLNPKPEENYTSLRSLRLRSQLAYDVPERFEINEVLVEPFSRRTVYFSDLVKEEKEKTEDLRDSAEGSLKAGLYDLKFDSQSGKITKLIGPKGSVIDGGEYGFASVVREVLADDEKNERSTFFPRNITDGNFSRSVWNHDWKGKREIPSKTCVMTTIESADRVIFRRKWLNSLGASEISIDLVFLKDSPTLELAVTLDVVTPYTPISYYLTLPTDLQKNWVGHFDTLGLPVELEKESIGEVSLDWLTLDSWYAASDESHGWLLLSPDAPLLMPNGFGFGKETKQIERQACPLILSWLCNNYWETNFNAGISGRLNFRYRLVPFETYEARNCQREATDFVRPVLTALTKQSEKLPDQTWYAFDSEFCEIQLFRMTESGILLTLRNLNRDKGEKFRFELKEGSIQGVVTSSPLLKEEKEVPHTENQFAAEIGAGGLANYLIKMIQKERR